jgi:hypothetical protein
LMPVVCEAKRRTTISALRSFNGRLTAGGNGSGEEAALRGQMPSGGREEAALAAAALAGGNPLEGALSVHTERP